MVESGATCQQKLVFKDRARKSIHMIREVVSRISLLPLMKYRFIALSLHLHRLLQIFEDWLVEVQLELFYHQFYSQLQQLFYPLQLPVAPKKFKFEAIKMCKKIICTNDDLLHVYSHNRRVHSWKVERARLYKQALNKK